MFDTSSTSSSNDPNKPSQLDPKEKLRHEQKLSSTVPTTATEEDKWGQRTSSRTRIKSHFKVSETATEHVSSSAADESRAKCARCSCEKSSHVPETNTKQRTTEIENKKTIKSQ